MQKQNHNMRTERKSSIKNSATRLILIALLVLIQTCWMIVLMSKLNTYSTAITLIMTCIAVIIALKVFGARIRLRIPASFFSPARTQTPRHTENPGQTGKAERRGGRILQHSE